MSSKGIWADIYIHLKGLGFEVYSPGQHKGEVLTNYVVVANSGTLQLNSFSSTQTLYDLMCYVPKDRFSDLESFVNDVKEAMKSLEPKLMPVYYETPAFFDEAINGHMISVQYRNTKKVYGGNYGH